MKLLSAHQVAWEWARSASYDCVIVASGYEPRATHLAENFRGEAGTKTAVGFKDRKVGARRDNDRTLRSLGFQVVEAAGDEASTIKQEIASALRSAKGKGGARLLIDYTSMTRVWYAAVLDVCREMNPGLEFCDVTFSYSAARYRKPVEASPNEHMGPIRGFSSLSLPDRPTALVIGMGYEKDRALGLHEHVGPKETYAFYASPAIDSRFVHAVLRNNSQLLHTLGEEHSIGYPLSDMQSTFAKLSSLVRGLDTEGFRVILAPLGPKPFTFLCFLLATSLPAIDVWRVSAGTGGGVQEFTAQGEVLAFTVRFVASDQSVGTWGRLFGPRVQGPEF